MDVIIIRKVPGLRKGKSYPVIEEDCAHWKVEDHQQHLVIVPKTHSIILIEGETLPLRYWSESSIAALKDTLHKGYEVKYTKEHEKKWEVAEVGHQFNPNCIYCSTGVPTEATKPANEKYLKKRIIELENQLRTLRGQLSATD